MGYNLRMQGHSQCHSCHIIQLHNLLSSCPDFYMHSGLRKVGSPHCTWTCNNRQTWSQIRQPRWRCLWETLPTQCHRYGKCGCYSEWWQLNRQTPLCIRPENSHDFLGKSGSYGRQTGIRDSRVKQLTSLHWFLHMIIVIMSLKFSMHLNFLLQMRCDLKPSELPFCLHSRLLSKPSFSLTAIKLLLGTLNKFDQLSLTFK